MRGGRVRPSASLRRERVGPGPVPEEQVRTGTVTFDGREQRLARLARQGPRLPYLIPFSCRGRSFCPSCEKKRQLLWAEWLRETLLAPVPHRHVVFTMPRFLRPLFRKRRELLDELSLAAAETLHAGHA